MPVTLAVLGAAAVAVVGVWAVARGTDPIDVVAVGAEDRVVEEAGRRPAVVRFVRRFSHRVAGSTFVGAAFAVVLVLAVLAGAVLDMVRDGTGVARFDSSVAEWGAANATDSSTTILTLVTQLGSSVGVLVIGAVVAWFEWRRTRSTVPATFLATVYGGHVLISNLIKNVVERERPFVEQLVDTFSSSFPSTHAGTAAAVWAAFALVLGVGRSTTTRIALATTAVVVAVAVAASRTLLGVHWLTDVVAGAAIGWGWFLLVTIAFGGRRLRFGEPAERMRADTNGRVAP